MRTALLLAALLVGLGATAGEPAKNAELERAQKALAAKKYADALTSLEAAEKKGGLDLDAYSTLVESKALALASTKKLDAATEELKRLLAMDPRRDLAGKYKGDVVRALDAALTWVAEAGGIQVAATEPVASNGRVTQVSLAVRSDPLSMVKSARIWVRNDGGAWKPTEVAVTNGAASADAGGAEVEYWAELFDGAKNQVKQLGSSIRPARATAPAAVAAAQPAPAQPAEQPAAGGAPTVEQPPKLTPSEEAVSADASVTGEAPKSGSILRPISYVVLGAALITAGVGVYFGAVSEAQKSSIRMDAASKTFSEQVLYDRDQARIGQAQLANAMFITAAAAAVIGVVLFVLGG